MAKNTRALLPYVIRFPSSLFQVSKLLIVIYLIVPLEHQGSFGQNLIL